MDILKAILVGLGLAAITLIIWYAVTIALIEATDYLRSRWSPPE